MALESIQDELSTLRRLTKQYEAMPLAERRSEKGKALLNRMTALNKITSQQMVEKKMKALNKSAPVVSAKPQDIKAAKPTSHPLDKIAATITRTTAAPTAHPFAAAAERFKKKYLK